MSKLNEVAAAIERELGAMIEPGATTTLSVLARASAKAAIAAMREPTESMQAAGAFPRENRRPVSDIWRAMIDAALSEKR